MDLGRIPPGLCESVISIIGNPSIPQGFAYCEHGARFAFCDSHVTQVADVLGCFYSVATSITAPNEAFQKSSDSGVRLSSMC